MVLPAGPIFSAWVRHASWLAGMVSLAVAMPGYSAEENPAPATKTPPSASATPGDISKRLLAEFRQSYALPDGKVVKRIAPPFSPGRLEFYRVHWANQATLIPEGPEYFLLHWDEPKPTDPNHTGWWSEGRLTWGRMGWVGGKGVELWSLIDSFTGIPRYELLGDRQLMDAKVSGDWVIRHGASPEKLLPELETILRMECKLNVRLRLVREDRKVIVAEGKYAYRPLPGRGTVNYPEGTEEGNWREGDYDVLEVFVRGRKDLWDETSYDLESLLKRLSRSIDRPVVNEVARAPKNELIVEDNVPRTSAPFKPTEWDEAALLAHLSKQTGLTFTEKTRRVRVLHVERAE